MSSTRNLSVASLYIHWPYCKRRCTYCNFNKYVSKFVDEERMKKCLVTELKTLLELSGVQKLSSLFFGGGTPSLCDPSTIESVVRTARNLANVDSDAEISLEVNPTAFQHSKLKEFSQAGVNRVSIGLQTLSDTGLRVLGRDHSANDSLSCLEAARKLFPSRVSVDLIFGWPGQTLDMWKKELNQVLPLCDNHISLYQLTLERGTELYKLVKSGQQTMLHDQTMEDMYLHAVDILSSAGYERYEVSNFARKGCYSQHNRSYWTGQQYIGIGPGAHGRFQPKSRHLREARVQTLAPIYWMSEIEKFGHATRKATPLSVLQQLEELLIVGLRTKWGVYNETWQSVCSEISLKEIFEDSSIAQFHLQKNLLEFDNVGFRATSSGINVIDSILVDLLNVLQEKYSKMNIKSYTEEAT